MERPLFDAANRRSKNPPRHAMSRPFEQEVARLFECFRLDIERMFGSTYSGMSSTSSPNRAEAADE